LFVAQHYHIRRYYPEASSVLGTRNWRLVQLLVHGSKSTVGIHVHGLQIVIQFS